jgi:hypothetical protein
MQTIKQYCEFQRFSMLRGAQQSFAPESPSIEFTLDNPHKQCYVCEECILENPALSNKPQKTKKEIAYVSP